MEPANVSPILAVPQHIKTPNYISGKATNDILEYPEIKNETQIACMRDSCKLAANLLEKIGNFVQVIFNETNILIKFESEINYRLG